MSIRVEYSFPGDATSDICRLEIVKTVHKMREGDSQGICIYELHENSMPRLVDWGWHREVMLVQHLGSVSK